MKTQKTLAPGPPDRNRKLDKTQECAVLRAMDTGKPGIGSPEMAAAWGRVHTARRCPGWTCPREAHGARDGARGLQSVPVTRLTTWQQRTFPQTPRPSSPEPVTTFALMAKALASGIEGTDPEGEDPVDYVGEVSLTIRGPQSRNPVPAGSEMKGGRRNSNHGKDNPPHWPDGGGGRL